MGLKASRDLMKAQKHELQPPNMLQIVFSIFNLHLIGGFLLTPQSALRRLLI